MPAWLKQKLWLPREMRRALGGAYRKGFVFAHHHESHAAAAFFPSPFEEAAIMSFDGVGEWATAALGTGRGHRVELSHELHFPHSLGLLYTAFTTYAGFAANSDEYKLMGLAPYGEPRFADRVLDRLMDLKPDGSFRLDLSYFDYAAGLRMTSERFHRLFGAPPRRPDEPITQHTMDVAASVQKVTEEVLLRAARHLHAMTGLRDLCLSGGVALNCVANGRLQREGPFERIWVQPASGDSGSALGVALLVWHQLLGRERRPDPSDRQRGSLLGPAFSEAEIEAALRRARVDYERIDAAERLDGRVVELLAAGRVVGWFQGRMEFGPRGLGSRSILADPRVPDMQRTINLKVKFREGFRPFAPAVLAGRASEHFEWSEDRESPYMLFVAPVRDTKRLEATAAETEARGFARLGRAHSSIPAVTHVDGSARLQTVAAGRHARFAALLDAFARRTGCPLLVNTSFNLGWEPIVCSPDEAVATFLSCELDALCIGPFLVEKRSQRATVSPGGARRLHDVLGDHLASPCCGGPLDERGSGFVCSRCRAEFPVSEGIPRLFWPHEGFAAGADVTEAVQAFYEENPFPNYEQDDSLRSLVDKSRRGQYAELLNRAIPANSSVLEVGCGTGQLSNFLGISCRRVVGTDLCLNSLRLGERFRAEHGLERVAFAQMNLFRPAFRPGSFDVLLCNGVLHHTSDPRGGFRRLVPLVRPGGYVVIGLYHRWGRLATNARRVLFSLTGGRGRWLDPRLRGERLGAERERAWFADQYRHPHESTHTTGEVLGWFEEAGIEPLRGLPALTLGEAPIRDLFHPAPLGSRFDRLLTQALQLRSGSREGGFFLTIGRRRAESG
jgi:carbamoyltransferase